MDKDILKMAAKYLGIEDPEEIARLEEGYHGEFNSEAEWAAQQVGPIFDDIRNFGGVLGIHKAKAEMLERYFDYEAYVRDARMNGTVIFFGHGPKVHVFCIP